MADILTYFKEVNAQKQINKLARKYKNKKIVIYGAGEYFRILKENYDLSKLNIVGIADKKFETNKDANIGTGMRIEITLNGESVQYIVVVKGDINGDGLANSLDSILIKAIRNEVTTINGAAKAAADINDDGKVNVADSKLLLYHRAEVTGYDLNFKK